MNDWCFKTFQRRIDSYPEEGFSIIAFKGGSCDYKSLYVVAVPFEEITRNAFERDGILLSNKNGVKVSPLSIALKLRFPIAFCPNCGKKNLLL